MARKKIRKVHIEDQTWIWVVHPTYYDAYMNIYSPDKKLHRVSVCDVINDHTPEMSAFFSDSYSPDLKVTPSKVKSYILTNILKKEIQS